MARMTLDESEFLEDAGRMWWLFLITGIAWLWIALIVLRLNLETVYAISILFGFVAIGAGVNELMAIPMSSTGWKIARGILGALAPEAPARAARDGARVGSFHFPEEAQAHLFLCGALRDLVDREPRASVAIIARDAAAARSLHALVAELSGGAAEALVVGERWVDLR